MKLFSSIFLSVVFIACILLSCSNVNVAGKGNSSGTGNGAIVYAESGRIYGAASPLAFARLYSKDWIPFLHSGAYADSLMADSSGAFDFPGVPRGSYNLIIFSVDRKKSGIFKNIPCQPSVAWADTIDSLKSPGALQGCATIHADTLALSYAYIQGTPFYAMTDMHGIFLLEAVAPSRYTLQFYGLYTKNGTGPLEAVTAFTITGAPVKSALIDSAVVTVYPDSISAFAR
jgi:hypothetical protein